VEDGHDLNELSPDAIDDSVVPMEHLTKRVIADLRDNASGQWVGLQAFDGSNQAFNKKVGGVR
jgi:hypothetical protein